MARPRATTVALVARAEKPKGSGMLPLYIRVHAEGQRRYVSTGLKVRKRDWNADRLEARHTHPNAGAFNETLAALKTQAAQVHADALAEARSAGKAVRLSTLVRTVRTMVAGEGEANGAEGLFAFMERRIEEITAEGKVPTGLKYRTVLRKMRSMEDRGSRRADIPFSEVDVEYVRAFEHYLKAVEGNGVNTLEKNLATLRAVIKEAIRRGLMKQADYPFFNVKLRRERVSKASLTTDEVDALAALDLPDEGWERLARDMWLFSFYAGGMRFGDVARLKWSEVKGGVLTYRMGKTGQEGSLKLIPPALAILEHYRGREGQQETVFPTLDGYDLSTPQMSYRAANVRNVHTNTALRRVAAKAGIETHMTFHTARHSLARYLRDKGMDIHVIQQLLRHSSVKITEGYLDSLGNDALDAAYSSAFADFGDAKG